MPRLTQLPHCPYGVLGMCPSLNPWLCAETPLPSHLSTPREDPWPSSSARGDTSGPGRHWRWLETGLKGSARSSWVGLHVPAHHPAIESANRNPADPYSSLHIQLTRQRLWPQYGQVEACLSCPLEHEALGIWEEHMWRSSQVPRNGNNTKYNSIPYQKAFTFLDLSP